MDKDWVNQLKGVQLKYEEILATCKSLDYEDLRQLLQRVEKGRLFAAIAVDGC